jgi:hypothetical protein
MTTDPNLAELTTANTPFEAELLVGALRNAGVSAVTFGATLADEYTGQSIPGASRVLVMVPKDQLERAEQALSEVKRKPPTSP